MSKLNDNGNRGARGVDLDNVWDLRILVRWDLRMKRGLDLVSQNGSLRSDIPFSFGFLGKSFLGKGNCSTIFRICRRCADGNLDSDLASSNFLALEELHGFLLLLFVSYIDESIAFAAPGLSEPPPDDASRDHVDTSGREELSKGSVVNVEGKIGDKYDGF